MIQYVFKCDCGNNFTALESPTKCRCGNLVKWFKIINSHHKASRPTKCNTIYSRALAIDPSQVEEATKMYPDEVYRINKKEGIAMLEIHNARERDKFAKRHGMVLKD